MQNPYPQMQIYGSGSLGTHGYPERPVSRRNALAFSGRLGMCGAEALAETEGFEPSVPDLPVRRFSKPLVSATHPRLRSEEHTSELQSLMRISYAFFCLKNKKIRNNT